MGEGGRSGRDRLTDWVAPEQRSAGRCATATGGADPPPDSQGSGLGPSSGIAVARGDAREPRDHRTGGDPGTPTPAGEDPATALVGNPLRSLGVVGPGSVLDQAFDLLRFRFRRWVALAAVLFVPVQLLQLWIALASGTTTSPSGVEGLSQLRLFDGPGTSGAGWVVTGLQVLGLFLLGMAAGHLVAGWLDGRDDPFGSVVASTARRIWVAPFVVIPAVLAKVVAACFGGVGFFLADALLFVAAPIAGGELLGPFATLGRSVRLARRSYGTALVVCIGGFCITAVLRFALGAGPLALVAVLGLPSEWLVVVSQAMSVTMLVTMPLTACIAARAHLDLRCRAEGFDLVRREAVRGLR